jgi:hypothetical protein
MWKYFEKFEQLVNLEHKFSSTFLILKILKLYVNLQ